MVFDIRMVCCVILQLEDEFVKEFEILEKRLDKKINWDVPNLKKLSIF